jgi:hypothetical protein
VLTHVDPQKAPLVHTQLPLVQAWPLVHAVPQAPQLTESVCRLLQLAPHRVPLVHPQAPLVQV